VKRRSPKNVAIARGLYDGPGGFDEPGKSIEAHLSKIESEAAPTPGWIEVVQGWMNDRDADSTDDVIEPPPEEFDSPPAALRHPTAQVVAALTRKTALVGRNETRPLQVTPRDVNRFAASTASEWVAGPTRNVVEQALRDRAVVLSHSPTQQ